ncbi:uncharacterized protein UV8b_07150 [Ustilaginoidea virens]|uniref:Uncharacterized protein n=1 Tax=Ustilaginoidea virens TaxID=1159556 RepID=A0A8E5HWI6_USTVR|nr:uncharacterized protein UV8b_07150 [Ustilaginoidea virens]QUC22909.1 hypothetical protein UV8b_07150 [Ustilaginoidea virens]
MQIVLPLLACAAVAAADTVHCGGGADSGHRCEDKGAGWHSFCCTDTQRAVFQEKFTGAVGLKNNRGQYEECKISYYVGDIYCVPSPSASKDRRAEPADHTTWYRG